MLTGLAFYAHIVKRQGALSADTSTLTEANMSNFLLSVQRARLNRDTAVALLEAAIRRIDAYLKNIPKTSDVYSAQENIWN